MAQVAAVCMLAGGVVLLVGSIMFLVAAFRTSVAWGIGSLLLAPVAIVFLVKNWQESKKSFLITLGGIGLMVLGGILGAAGGGQ